MKKIELKCSNCGANMKISPDKTEAICPYCANQFLIKKEATAEELAKKAEELSYAREKGEIRAIEEHKKSKFKTTLLIIASMIAIMIASVLLYYYSLPYIDDPFKCISVKFTGIDENGTIDINDTKQCDITDIEYKVSKDGNLKEGEQINVFVISNKYRFGTSRKKYTVSGLSLYLTNPQVLTNKHITKLHDFSYKHLKSNLGITFKGEVVKLVPYKIFLYTNNKNKNTLYDLYKISIKTKSGKVYNKYVSAYYENFILLNNNELFSYSHSYHCGYSILAGDPNTYSTLSNDYVGFIIGFQDLNEFKMYINKKNDGSFEIKERKN